MNNTPEFTEETRSAWIAFSKTVGWTDLLGRFVANELTYQMNGMKSSTIEGKGIAMAQMEAVYNLRSGIIDIVKPKSESKPAQRQSKNSAASK